MLFASTLSYEQRNWAVKATSIKEKRYWAEVTVDIMSDEAKVGDKKSAASTFIPE